MKVALAKLGLCGHDSDAAPYFQKFLEKVDKKEFRSLDFFRNAVITCTDNANEEGKGQGSTNNLRGKWFEFAIALVLIDKGITPFYYQTSLAFVSDVVFDFIIFTDELSPICLSAKTSLRERRKQTDLEALALKSVYRKSKSYLLTIDSNDKSIKNLERKIDNKDVLGLDGVYGSNKIQAFLDTLKEHKPILTKPVKIVRKGKTIGT